MTYIRNAVINDINRLLTIQAECYDEHLVESAEVFASMLSNGLSIVTTTGRGEVIAYLLAHFWDTTESPPPLHEVFHGDAIKACKVCFMHDLVVSPRYRNQGIASRMIDVMEELSDLPLTLVALASACKFWEKHGFVKVDSSRSLESYGENATFMMKERR